jgi:hypothetical protein
VAYASHQQVLPQVEHIESGKMRDLSTRNFPQTVPERNDILEASRTKIQDEFEEENG